MKLNTNKGFTLIELLVVVAIIGLLATVVLAALGAAKNKGSDAAVKSNLKNSVAQAEVFYNYNTVANYSYTGVCTNGPVGSPAVNGIGAQVLAAAKAAGLAAYNINSVPSAPSTSLASCNDSATAWAAEVPLKNSGANQVWCVDSSGKSKQEGVSIGATTACN